MSAAARVRDALEGRGTAGAAFRAACPPEVRADLETLLAEQRQTRDALAPDVHTDGAFLPDVARAALTVARRESRAALIATLIAPLQVGDDATDGNIAYAVGLLREDSHAYRLLADRIINAINPPDGDDDEGTICGDAVDRLAAFAASQPCLCALPVLEGDPCERCTALGRHHDRPVQR